MPINGMQLGSDLQLMITDTNLGILTFTNLTMVSIKQRTKNIRSVGINGVIKLAEIPDGWMIDIALDVGNAALVDYVLKNEGLYYAGGPIGSITGQTTATFPGGFTQIYRFTGGAIKVTDAGDYKGQEKVSQKAQIEFARGYLAT
jgi:hypothetical protein